MPVELPELPVVVPVVLSVVVSVVVPPLVPSAVVAVVVPSAVPVAVPLVLPELPPELPLVLVPSSMTVAPQFSAIPTLAKHVGSPFKDPTISDELEQLN